MAALQHGPAHLRPPYRSDVSYREPAGRRAQTAHEMQQELQEEKLEWLHLQAETLQDIRKHTRLLYQAHAAAICRGHRVVGALELGACILADRACRREFHLIKDAEGDVLRDDGAAVRAPGAGDRRAQGDAAAANSHRPRSFSVGNVQRRGAIQTTDALGRTWCVHRFGPQPRTRLVKISG